MRPDPARWVWYGFGGGLPAAYRDWVFHDLTAPGWQVRHMLRTTLQLAPFALALGLLLPGEPWMRVVAVFGGLLMGWFYGFAYLHESVEHRSVKAGFPRGAAAAAQDAPHAADRAAREARYAQRWR